MKRLLFVSLLVICCIIVSGMNGTDSFAADRVIKESDIPSVDAAKLKEIIGKEKGKRVVVINIFASWCPPCREEVPGIVNIRKMYPEKDLALYGISVDDISLSLVSFVNKSKINYPVMQVKDDIDAFLHATGVKAVPYLFIYNRKGKLLEQRVGYVGEEDLTKAIKEALAE